MCKWTKTCIRKAFRATVRPKFSIFFSLTMHWKFCKWVQFISFCAEGQLKISCCFKQFLGFFPAVGLLWSTKRELRHVYLTNCWWWGEHEMLSLFKFLPNLVERNCEMCSQIIRVPLTGESEKANRWKKEGKSVVT